MKRGNLIIYNKLDGSIISQTGFATGDVLPHEYPENEFYIEIPYEEAVTFFDRRLVRINPETKKCEFEDSANS